MAIAQMGPVTAVGLNERDAPLEDSAETPSYAEDEGMELTATEEVQPGDSAPEGADGETLDGEEAEAAEGTGEAAVQPAERHDALFASFASDVPLNETGLPGQTYVDESYAGSAPARVLPDPDDDVQLQAMATSDGALQPLTIDNTQYYYRSISQSGLIVTPGGYERVFCTAGGAFKAGGDIYVERYDSSFKLLERLRLSKELDYYGGLISGGDANYLRSTR